jgi:hypothetical protein
VKPQVKVFSLANLPPLPLKLRAFDSLQYSDSDRAWWPAGQGVEVGWSGDGAWWPARWAQRRQTTRGAIALLRACSRWGPQERDAWWAPPPGGSPPSRHIWRKPGASGKSRLG